MLDNAWTLVYHSLESKLIQALQVITESITIDSASKDKNYLSAEEFVFPNKFQIIPVYSFTVMRKDHYILWKDDNVENEEKSLR